MSSGYAKALEENSDTTQVFDVNGGQGQTDSRIESGRPKGERRRRFSKFVTGITTRM